jgi:hypothetical protein
MVGRIVLMNERAYVLCAECGINTPFVANTLDGCTCGLHDHNALYKQNRRFLMLNTQVFERRPTESVQQLFGRVSARAQANAEEEMVENLLARSLATTLQRAANEDADNKTKQPREHEGCIFCETLGAMTGGLAHQMENYTFMIKKNARLVHAKVCRRDERLGWGALQSVEAGGYPELDKCIKSVAKGRLRVTMGIRSGEKMVLGKVSGVLQ